MRNTRAVFASAEITRYRVNSAALSAPSMPCGSTRFIGGCSEVKLPCVRSFGGAGAASQLSLMRHLWPLSHARSRDRVIHDATASRGGVGAHRWRFSNNPVRCFSSRVCTCHPGDICAVTDVAPDRVVATHASPSSPPAESPTATCKQRDPVRPATPVARVRCFRGPRVTEPLRPGAPAGYRDHGQPAAHSGIFQIRPHENTPEAVGSALGNIVGRQVKTPSCRFHQKTR